LKSLTFTYYQKKIKDFDAIEQKLYEMCKQAIHKSYAPYSEFNVGCALLLDDNTIITGANQENAAYPQCLCAEMVTLSTYSSQYQDRKILKLMVYATHKGNNLDMLLAPCGQCRQTIFEFEERQRSPIQVYMVEGDQFVVVPRALNLLPFAFSKFNLNK
jgi:cytidine deaminase